MGDVHVTELVDPLRAHRGLDEVYPENTLIAYKAALEKGMAIEIDLRGTSDDELVVVHDDNLTNFISVCVE